MELLLYSVAIGGVSVAAYTDFRIRKIPNVLTYGMLIAGLLLGFAASNLASHSLGLVVGLFPALALFYLGSIGGGDAKLLGALGAVLGYPLIIDILVWSLLLGTVGSLLIILLRGRFVEMLQGFWVLICSLAIPGAPKYAPVNDIKIPFAVAIALGTLVVLFVPEARISSELTGLLF